MQVYLLKFVLQEKNEVMTNSELENGIYNTYRSAVAISWPNLLYTYAAKLHKAIYYLKTKPNRSSNTIPIQYLMIHPCIFMSISIYIAMSRGNKQQIITAALADIISLNVIARLYNHRIAYFA